MIYSDTEQVVEQALDFPITHPTMVDQIGAIEIRAPSGDSVTIAEVLADTGEENYPSADALYDSIVGNLNETFIGRKYYDDRGGTAFGSVPDGESTVSF
jgi:hypothetical protein